MSARIPLNSAVLLCTIAACLITPASAASLGVDWTQEPTHAGTVFSGVVLNPDASQIFSGGSQILVRSWDDRVHWGGAAGFNAAMSTDGTRVVTGAGNAVTLYTGNGQQCWTRNMDGEIRAVAVSANGSLVVAADDRGNYHSWTPSGDYIAMNRTTDRVRRIAIAPEGDFFAVTTDAGMRYYSPALKPLWTDSREGGLDEYIFISADGETVISAGGTRLSSHTATGTLSWQADVAKAAINDVACNRDCSIIVTASQDNTVRAIDRYGKIHWHFDTGQWPNAVASSRKGDVIAAGANDGTLYILDHGGSLITKRKFESRIQPRTLAISSDGTRVVTADQNALYGLSLTGINGDTSDTIFVSALSSPTITATAVTSATITPEITIPEEIAPKETAIPPPTHQSPAGIGVILAVITGGACAILIRKR